MALKEIGEEGRQGGAIGAHLQNETVGAGDPAFPLHTYLGGGEGIVYNLNV